MTDFPTHTKRLPQIWIEDNQYVIESSSFKYVISCTNNSRYKKANPEKLLFKLCKRMKAEAIDSTYQYK